MEWCSRWISGQLKLHGGTLSGKKKKKKAKQFEASLVYRVSSRAIQRNPVSGNRKKKKKRQNKSINYIWSFLFLFCFLRQGFFLYVILTVLELGLLVCIGVGTPETVLTDGCRCLDFNQSSWQEQQYTCKCWGISLVCILSPLPCHLRVIRSFETIATIDFLGTSCKLWF